MADLSVKKMEALICSRIHHNLRSQMRQSGVLERMRGLHVMNVAVARRNLLVVRHVGQPVIFRAAHLVIRAPNAAQ